MNKENQEWEEKIIQEWYDRKSRCIATDAEYSCEEMLEILSNHIKSSVDEDAEWIKQKLSKAREEERVKIKEAIQKIRANFKCGKCDGAIILEHSLFCKALTGVSKEIEK